MFSHPELGSDSPIGLDREPGCDTPSREYPMVCPHCQFFWKQESYQQTGRHKTGSSSLRNSLLLLGRALLVQILC